ncbi:hypothetical protein VPH35_119672 [Triticum aestivum]
MGGRRITEKRDVYSFGILLQIVEHGNNFHGDPDAASEGSQRWFPVVAWTRELVQRMCKVAFWCAQQRPSARPPMSSMVKMLEGETEIAPPRNLFHSLYGNETDRLSLLEFRKATLDPLQALVSWNDSIHFACKSLDWDDQGLVGKISPSLANLTLLKDLFLDSDNFTGKIPPSLGHLHRLQRLVLSNNTLQGFIPSFANCSNLRDLFLNRNNLVGQIPMDLPLNLAFLDLQFNELTGIVPDYLGNMTTLLVIHCVYNNIQGNIPNGFATLPSLQYINMAKNKLVGRFPQAIWNISTLDSLCLSYNYLTGEVTSNLGKHLPNLKELVLSGNLFQGHIPLSLINASKLSLIDISNNNFTGVVPSSIGKLTKLYKLNLEDNKLEAHSDQDWEFMYSLANCSELQIFSITSNRLEGHLPASLGNLSNQLQVLYLGGNKLSWSFPSGIQNLANLTRLGLSCNQFTGGIPEWLGSIKKLQTIGLHHNDFTGFLPISLSNLSLLGNLFLNSNKFGGLIPPGLGNLQMLQQLNISDNNLHGRVPKEIFRIPTILAVDLSFNNLDGHLPTEIGNSRQLAYFSLSTNKKRKSLLLPSFGRQFPKVSFNDITRATQGFATSSIIGRGRYGSVYQGKLFQDGSDVAIKVFSLETRGSQKSFIAECNALRNVCHRNLVPILTACSSIDSNGNDFKALVYEFMPGGDLHRLLYSTQDDEGSSDRRYVITLAQRLSIVVDVADALEYLHHNNQRTIVHCDMKPSNILSDDSMTAHVGDFGLCKV